MRAVMADHAAGRRVAIERELKRQGNEVLSTDDPEVALEGAKDASLVVLGWQVGDDSAVSLCRRLRHEVTDEEPVVVLVASEAQLNLEAATAAGASDVWVVREDAEPEDVAVRVALARHYARLQTRSLKLGGELALLRRALDLSGTGFVLTDPRLEDDPIVYANRSFYEMTGYAEDEVLGHNCRFLQGPETDPVDVQRLREALATQTPVKVHLLNHTKTGKAFHNEVHVAQIRDASGTVVRHVGVQLDVTAHYRQGQQLEEEQHARLAAEDREQRSGFLARASPALDASLDEDDVAAALAELVIQRLDACLVYGPRAGEWVLVEARGRLSELQDAVVELTGVSLDRGAPAAQILGRSGVLALSESDAVQLDPELSARLGDLGHGDAWLLSVALRSRGDDLGLLVAIQSTKEPIGNAERELVGDLADRASLALENAQLFQAQTDANLALHGSFLPTALPHLPGLQLAAAYRPADAAIRLGGDFYDVVALPDGSVALMVGDVTGKGAKAAALTSLCRHTLRAAWTFTRDPIVVMDALNRALLSARTDRGLYATAVLCLLQPDAANWRVTVVCAGHPPPQLRTSSAGTHPIGETGSLLGRRAELQVHATEHTLTPKDTLVLYTDGVAALDIGPIKPADLTDLIDGDLPLDVLVGRLEAEAHRSQHRRRRDDIVILAARAT